MMPLPWQRNFAVAWEPGWISWKKVHSCLYLKNITRFYSEKIRTGASGVVSENFHGRVRSVTEGGELEIENGDLRTFRFGEIEWITEFEKEKK